MELIKELLNKKDIKKDCIFLGVPMFKQTPALINVFNKTKEEIEKLINENKIEEKIKEDLDRNSLEDLISFAVEIKGIEDIIRKIPDDFEKWWNVFKTRRAKFTSALFYLNPKNFIPVNKYTVDLFGVKDLGKLEAKEYIEICKGIKEDEKKFKEKDEEFLLFPILSAYGFYSKNVIAEILKSYENTKNIILTGAPGVGKTYSIKQYLKQKLGDEYEERVAFMQFHPGIEYEDFIEGIKPVGIDNSGVKLKLINGAFKEFCKKAIEHPEKDYYFVIDEINRANLSAVFGELLNAIEYRIKVENKKPKNPDDLLETQYFALINSLDENEKKELSLFEEYPGKFGVPENIYILGTMNDIDRSIESFDLALRRRFVWVEMEFDENVIRFKVKNPEELIKRAKKLNKKLEEFTNSKSFIIGHAYFLKMSEYESYESLWNYHLKPLIREYLRDIFIDEKELEDKLKDLEKIFVNG